VRTLQEHIAVWRAQHGPTQEVMFPQIHRPGVDAQSDFTHMESLGVTLGGVPFPHLVFHLVLSYSNIEAIQICFSESFESLVEGIETCLWSIGGVPQRHRTDHLSAAIHPLDAQGRAEAKQRYSVLMGHYGLEPTTNNLGVAHENGDVEQSHFRFKAAVDQALRVRGVILGEFCRSSWLNVDVGGLLLACAFDQPLTRQSDNLGRDRGQAVDRDDALDLRKESLDQTKVAARDARNRVAHGGINRLTVGHVQPKLHPALLDDALEFPSAQRLELMYEADP
jgi:hypothetical protein